jgi:hypothetical protein
MKKYIKAGILAALSTQAFGGGWVSGGAKNIQDSLNPWFIQNTTSVRYCVVADSEHFSLDTEVATKLVGKAIAHWQKFFQKARAVNVMAPEVTVGSQDFIYEACGPNTGLVFQLGTLTSQEQRDFLGKTPGQYAAISVRTSYDLKNLRGKGFIYFSPDSGTDRYFGPTSSESFWDDKEGLRFLLLAIHELGHVFGVPHIDFARSRNEHIMSTSIIEAVVGSKESELSAQRFTYDIHLSLQKLRERNCPRPTSPLLQFLGVSESDCFEYRYENQKINVYKIADSDEVVGSIVLQNTKEDARPFNWLVITPQQKVLDYGGRGLVSAAVPVLTWRKVQYTGAYYPKGTSVAKTVLMTIDDAFQTVDMTGVTDKGVISLLSE